MPLERTVSRVLTPVTTPPTRRLLIDTRNCGAGGVAAVRGRFFGDRLRPGYLIVGAQKAGTTFLYLELNRHAQIAPALTKEVCYFSDHFGRGLRWYQGFFSSSAGAARSGRVLTGEATPEYLFHPHAAARIAESLPEVKIIVLIRDPVRRAFSQYQHERRLGYEPLATFEEALGREEERTQGELERVCNDPHYFSYPRMHYAYRARGRYREQLEWLYQHIDPSRVLVLIAEDMFRAPCRTVGQVVDFLEIDAWSPSQPGRNDMAAEPGMMTSAARRELNDYFIPHNRELGEFLGRDLPWTSM